MEKETGKRVKLGIFVTVAVIIAVMAVFLIGRKQHLFGGSFRISASFVDVGGLQVGNNVRFVGVDVGSVENVTITSSHSARIDMIISDEAQKFIRKDAMASVGSESIMGNKVVVLSSGTDGAEQIADGDEIRSTPPINMDDITKKLSHMVTNADVISENLAALTKSMRSGKGAFGKLFTDQKLGDDVSITVSNLKSASGEFRNFIEAARKSWLLWGSGKTKAEKKREEKEKEEKEREKEKGKDK